MEPPPLKIRKITHLHTPSANLDIYHEELPQQALTEIVLIPLVDIASSVGLHIIHDIIQILLIHDSMKQHNIIQVFTIKMERTEYETQHSLSNYLNLTVTGSKQNQMVSSVAELTVLAAIPSNSGSTDARLVIHNRNHFVIINIYIY